MTRIRTRLTILVGAAVAALAAPALALAQKPGGGSGTSASKAGDNLADLISGNLDQLLIALVGVFGLAAFFSRSIGQAVMIVAGGMFAGVFIIEPAIAEQLFKGIYEFVL